jgi:LCP family protein required for cell wall assembly
MDNDEKPGKKASRRELRRKNVRRKRAGIAISVLISLMALSMIGVAGVWSYVNYRYNQVVKVDLRLSHYRPGSAFTVLLIGSDSRSNISCNSPQAQQYGCSQTVAGQRSDVIILVRIIPAENKAAILSIPRDTWVPIAGTDYASRINAAFNNGPQQLVDTIEQNFGIQINHYVEADFQGFQAMVDALGGINMYFSDPLKDAYSDLNITSTGCLHINGYQALTLVRARHLEYFQNGYWQYDGTSDYGRIERQHQFIKAVINRAEQVLFTNPFALNHFVSAAAQSLVIDSSFSLSSLISLAKQFKTFQSESLPDYEIQTHGTVINGADVLLPIKSEDKTTIEEFLNAGASTPSQPASTSIPYSKISVQVLNGSGVPNIQNTTQNQLEKLGFATLAPSADANNFFYSQSVIKYSPGNLSAARELGNIVNGPVQYEEDSSLNTNQLILITGSQFTGISSSTPTVSQSTTTLESPLHTTSWDPVPC